MTREEETKQAANSFAYVIRDCATSRTEEDFIQGANWADEHPSQQSLARELSRLGYTITLNGDIISKEEENKMVENYMKYKQEQLIEKACKWLKENTYNYQLIFSENIPTFILDFKKEMEK